MNQGAAIKFLVIGIVLETGLYAVYTALFTGNVWLQISSSNRLVERPRRARRIALGISLALFTLVTAHWILSFCRLYAGFVTYRETPGGPGSYFTTLNTPMYIAQIWLYTTLRLSMDGLLVWRLFVVWQNNALAVLPSLFTFAGDFVAAVMFCYYTLQRRTVGRPAYHAGKDWLRACYVLSCCTNIFATGLIAFRVIARNRSLRPFSFHTSLMPVFLIVIESAAIYSVCNILAFVFYLTNHLSPVSVILQIFGPIAGIVYSLLSIQLFHSLTRATRQFSVTAPTLGHMSTPLEPASLTLEECGDTNGDAPLNDSPVEGNESSVNLTWPIAKTAQA